MDKYTRFKCSAGSNPEVSLGKYDIVQRSCKVQMLRSEQKQTADSIETQHHDNDIETCLAKAFRGERRGLEELLFGLPSQV